MWFQLEFCADIGSSGGGWHCSEHVRMDHGPRLPAFAAFHSGTMHSLKLLKYGSTVAALLWRCHTAVAFHRGCARP